MRPQELRAQQIISNCYKCQVVEKDVETHLGLHDFEIALPDQREAVEVTTATNQAFRGLIAAIEKKATGSAP